MKNRYLKSLFAFTLLLPLLSFAEVLQDHHPVGIRKPTEETVSKEEECEGSAGFHGRTYPLLYFPNGTHSVVALSAFGDIIEIEDGSQFRISPFDAPKVAGFRAQDPILITQNHSWFSTYEYRIINQSTGSVLEAYLSVGPTVGGLYTRYIVSIDSYRGEIFLSDSTRWLVSSLDMDRFYGWCVGDSVIIGYNSGWDQNSLGILINVPMNQHIRVAEF